MDDELQLFINVFLLSSYQQCFRWRSKDSNEIQSINKQADRHLLFE